MKEYDFEFMRTQYELLQSPQMAERVASALKLGEDLAFFHRESFRFSIYEDIFSVLRRRRSRQLGQESIVRTRPSDIVAANRDVCPVLGSRLVDIAYSDPNPGRAQKIAAAYADAFIASNLDKRFEANSYAKVFLEDQLAQLKVRLEQSEKALLDFGQKQEIVQTNDKESIAETNLASANAALGTLIAERMKNEELWKQLAVGEGDRCASAAHQSGH